MKLIEKLRRPNWLNELRAFAIATIVLVLAFTAYDVYNVTLGGGAVIVETPAPLDGVEEFVVGGQTMRYETAVVSIVDPTPAQVSWYLATTVPSTILLLAVMAMLLRMLTRARRANPFTRATVWDLRWTAVILMGGGLLVSLVEAVASVGLSQAVSTYMFSGIWKVPQLWLLVGFGTLAVSEIVARGCAMREELDEVV